MSRELTRIKLREVALSGSRPSLPETVNALAESMRESGLINPITVRPAPVYDGTIMVQGHRVVAGNHRVAAARALGWEEIDAFVVADDDRLVAELIEIDENLVRAELTPAQRAYAIKRRKEIWEAMHPHSGTSDSTIQRGPGRPKEFASETSDVAGMTKQAINRHVSRAEALGNDLDEVVGTSLDKGVELDALKSIPADERRELIERAKAGEQVSARSQDQPTPSGYITTLIDDLFRMSRKFTPGQVAESIASRPLNPDLFPYVEAVYIAFRAESGGGKRRGEA